ncbi:MAG: multidrug transporter MatE [Lachnospiraceae bacterium]|jgi:Na+-driven multidrug efflux pump|nr:multidrug transporter MatE [Lachnospiraceae bacterium]
MGATNTPKLEIEKQFGKYVWASMITMVIQGIYSIVDGLFLSNLIGDKGLSAIGVAWPIMSFVVALGTGIGCGGAVIMSMRQGAGDWDASNKARANTLIALGIAGVGATVLFNIILTPALHAMGVYGELYDLAMKYARLMVMGCAVQIFSAGLPPILRNDKRTTAAMTIMVCSMGIHMVILFVLLYGFGATTEASGVASLAAQAFTITCCLSILFGNKKNPIRREHFEMDWSILARIAKNAVSPFGISLTPSLLILYHNVQCIKYGGDIGIAVYSVITSTVGSWRLLLIGVAEGIQPLASFAYGANAYDAMKRIRNKALVTAISVSVFLFLFTLATTRFYPGMFGFSGELAAAIIPAVMLTSVQLAFTGVVRVSNSFFYAVGKYKYSLFMIYFDPLVMTPILLAVLPRLFGMTGIWICAPVAQLILNIIAFFMYAAHDREITRLRDAAAGSAAAPPDVSEGACA